MVPKKRGMKEEDLCASSGVHKALWQFRALRFNQPLYIAYYLKEEL